VRLAIAIAAIVVGPGADDAIGKPLGSPTTTIRAPEASPRIAWRMWRSYESTDPAGARGFRADDLVVLDSPTSGKALSIV